MTATRPDRITAAMALGLTFLALFASAAGAQPSFTPLGKIPGADDCGFTTLFGEGISGDGSTLVGQCRGSAISPTAFRWTAATGMVAVDSSKPLGFADGASFDGSVIVGFGPSGIPGAAGFRWELGSGTVFIPGTSQALGVSGDGSTVVGISSGSPLTRQGFRWTAADGVVLLHNSGTCGRSEAYATNGDGSVIVGVADDCFGADLHALRWEDLNGDGIFDDLGSGETRRLGFLSTASSSPFSSASAISEDGSVIVGASKSASGSGHAFRWTEAEGMVDLGYPPGFAPSTGSAALDVASVGCTVVGNATGAGFIWDPVNGMRLLQDVLVNDFGLDLSGFEISEVHGISDDGTVIAGDVINLSLARLEPFRAVIDNPHCAVDVVPVADAGDDQTVDEADPVTLDGTGSSDPQGDPLGYEWVQVAGTPVMLSDPTAAQPSFSAPYVSANTTLTFELVVDDGTNFSDPDTVDVTVVNVNNPPVADAGDDATIKEGAVATLDGGNSFDPEGDTPLFFSWTQTAGPAVALQPSDTAASPSFTAPLGVGTLLTFDLSVDDGKEVGASDSVTVEVVENSTPLADAGADQTVDEGTSVGLDGSGSSDPDGGDTLSFQWTQVAGTPVTLTGATSATPSFDAPSVPAGGEDLVFELVVTDDDPVNPKSSAADSVTVSVLNVNDPPQCDLAQSACPTSKLDDRDGCLLWPPNHKMVSAGISGVTDPDADSVTIEITGVTQDEPVNGQGDGDSSPDAVIQAGNPADSVLLRAERTGLGGAQENGRVYVVEFTADDGIDSCAGTVTVGVPHDRKDTPVDDGQLFDSTQP